MGTDIHGFVEIKKDGVWSRFEEEAFIGRYSGRNKHIPFADRDYVAFGLLAGVRDRVGNFVPVDIPRGLPKLEDTSLSKQVRRDINNNTDFHSKSYLSAKEIRDHIQNGVFSGWLYGKAAFMQDLETLISLGNPDDVRFVFWFDN